jgi:hypothetical protein
MKENTRKANSRGEQDWRREELNDDEIPWLTKKFAGNGCRGWKMAERIIPTVICGLARRSTRNRSCWMSWIPGTKRQSQIGSLGQLLLPTCRAISASPPSLGLRELTVRGSSELTASGHHLHTSSLCTSSPCMIILLPPVVRPALILALPRRRSPCGCPCQIIAVRGLVALRAGLSRAATLQLHPRTFVLRALRAATPPHALIRRSNA